MAIDAQRWQFTVSDFMRMGEAGIFCEGDRVELIDGKVRTMSPVGPEHIAIVNRLTALLVGLFDKRGIVSIQNPLQLHDYTSPLPDVAVLCFQENFYADKPATSEDVLLLIEVADSSLGYDSNEKMLRYAEVGILEYWIVDVGGKKVIQYTGPNLGGYENKKVFDAGDIIVFACATDLSLEIKEIF